MPAIADINVLIQKYVPNASKVSVDGVLKETESELDKIYANAVKTLKEQGKTQSKLNAQFAPLESKLNDFLAELHDHLPKMRAVLNPQQLAAVGKLT